MQFPRQTENNCPIHRPTGTQRVRVKSRFGCVEITEYRVLKWPLAGKSTQANLKKRVGGERQALLIFAFVFPG